MAPCSQRGQILMEFVIGILVLTGIFFVGFSMSDVFYEEQNKHRFQSHDPRMKRGSR